MADRIWCACRPVCQASKMDTFVLFLLPLLFVASSVCAGAFRDMMNAMQQLMTGDAAYFDQAWIGKLEACWQTLDPNLAAAQVGNLIESQGRKERPHECVSEKGHARF